MELIETKQQFIELRAKGYSFDKIAKELGKAKQTLIDWSKDLEDEIANLKALELEALYEKYYLLKENRIKTFGELILKLTDEVKSRDLSEVPTDKLLELLLKFESQVKDEVVDPQFKTSTEIKEDRLDKELLDELTSIQSQPIRRLKVG